MSRYTFKESIENIEVSGCFLPARNLFNVNVMDQSAQRLLLENDLVDQNHPRIKIPGGAGTAGELIFMSAEPVPELFIKMLPGGDPVRLYPGARPVPPDPPDPPGPPHPPGPPEPPGPLDPPVAPPAPGQDLRLSACRLNHSTLFPYLYIRPWPRISTQDRCSRFVSFPDNLFSATLRSNRYYHDLVTGKKQGDRAVMEQDSVEFIDKDKKYGRLYIRHLDDFSTFMEKYASIFDWLHDQPRMDCLELDAYITTVLGDWRCIRKTIFGTLTRPKDPTQFPAAYKGDKERAWQSFFALAITLGFDLRGLQSLVKTLVSAKIIEGLALISYSQEPPLIPDKELFSMAWASILFPEQIFPLPPEQPVQNGADPCQIRFVSDAGWMAPYAVGDLQVVKYKPEGYELGEICHIENILKGECKEVTRRHRRIFEDTITEKTGQSRQKAGEAELTTTDFLNEINKTLFQKTATTNYTPAESTGRSIGGWVVDENPAGGDWRNASRFAKKMVSKTVDRISRKVGRIRSQSLLEENEETIVQRFDNQGGDRNIRGIYRWVNSVYSLKTVPKGHRLIIEMTVLDPAENYKKQHLLQPEDVNIPIPPKALGVKSYADITDKIATSPRVSQGRKGPGLPQSGPFYYLDLLNRYEAGDLFLPPKPMVVTAVIQGIKPSSTARCAIPKGYIAKEAAISMAFKNETATATVMVGKHQAVYPPDPAKGHILGIALDESSPEIQISIICGDLTAASDALFKNDYSVVTDALGSRTSKDHYYTANVDVRCEPSPEAMNAWKYQTYQEIIKGYNRQRRRYYRRIRRLEREMLATNQGIARDMERQQIQSKCMGLLGELYPVLVDKKCQGELNRPRYVQFLDEVLQWEEMTYRVNPDYGSPQNKAMDYTESEFWDFLRAGSARVLVPVNPSRSLSFLFFLLSGMIWPGQDRFAPVFTACLSAVNQLKSVSEKGLAPGRGADWKIVVPTPMTVIQDSPELPTGQHGGGIR